MHTVQPHRPRLRSWLVGGAIVALAGWLLFLDSHSVVKRVMWSRELAQKRTENTSLQTQINDLERQIEEADTPEVVERVAREQYGMRRPGETVYRIEEP